MKNEITVDGITYVRKDKAQAQTNGLTFVVIRSRDSGCHAGYLKSEQGNNVELVNARRIWNWHGATTLSQLAAEGVKEPEKCKFGQAVDLTVYMICEKIAATEQARASIEGVKEWKV